MLLVSSFSFLQGVILKELWACFMLSRNESVKKEKGECMQVFVFTRQFMLVGGFSNNNDTLLKFSHSSFLLNVKLAFSVCLSLP